ncbi:MAG: hypothetical protein H5U05_09340 [Candidatus Aminicenantes bacterium]|nr:hypothetical protein [Candidatus Aminicenantes bacterium]
MVHLLFSNCELRQVLQQQETNMFKEIDEIEGNQLLNTSVEDLCDYFEQKYKLETPKLRENEIIVEQREIDIDISQDPYRHILDRSRPFYIKGTEIRFFVPYDGDEILFHCRPSRFTLNLPQAQVDQGQLIISFRLTDHDAARIKDEFNKTLSQIKEYLNWINEEVSRFNNSLRDKARQKIDFRRQKLLKDQGLVESLGFPLRKRPDAIETYVAPIVRRKITPRLPSANTAPFVPEPTLDLNAYEHILTVICNMAKVIERSPQAFKQMQEENLRQHFLVQLNGQYEGQATGETFNFQGKTDILIRVNGRNIFIAECKFWKGPKCFKEAIDQLLSYTSWRDTKTALLIFNRNKQLSNVLEQIPRLIKDHPNYKRQLEYASETGFRFILHHRDDTNRELILTVLVFEVPR